MSREARSRVVLGAGIPFLAFLFLGALILAFSRILLAVPVELAPWVALLFATNILVGCALAAMIPGTRGFTFLIALLVATIVVGGVMGIVVGPRPVHSLIEEGEHGVTATAPEMNEPSLSDEPIPTEETAGGAPGEPGGEPVSGGGASSQEADPVPVAAQGLAFDTSELSFPADTPVVIAFDNQDVGQPHNVAIYTEQGGEPLFQGEVVPGPSLIDYHVPQMAPGEYYFQCDVHPTMSGTVTVG